MQLKANYLQPLQKVFVSVSYKAQYNLAIALPDIYLNELKTDAHTETCKWMFTAALLTTAKNWKQPRCYSIGNAINKPWYVHSVEYFQR